LGGLGDDEGASAGNKSDGTASDSVVGVGVMAGGSAEVDSVEVGGGGGAGELGGGRVPIEIGVVLKVVKLNDGKGVVLSVVKLI